MHSDHDEARPSADAAPATPVASARRQRLDSAVIATAAKLLPLIELLDAIQPQVANDSIFHTRRLRMDAHIKRAYAELRAEKPRRKALLHAFKAIGELVREETQDIGKDELKQAAREVVLATLKNAPGLISAAHQAQLLS
jgi:hypothetical protein